METTLFVGNLAFNVTKRDLVELFSPHGIVVEAKTISDRETGRPRGFAFVTINSEEDAQAAIDELNGKAFQGRPLKVNQARPREEAPGGFGQRRDSGRR